jgi:hypothetical protein
VIKFKDAMVYANPKMSLVEIPENSTSDQAFEVYQGGKKVATYTNGDLSKHAQNLWDSHFSQSSHDDHPVYMSLNLETPLALASFIANNANLRKVYIPATFNVNKIIESIKTQHSETVVVDQDLFQLQPPKEKAAEYE